MAGTIVIPASELERIRQTLLPEDERASATGAKSQKQTRERTLELHTRSQARAKTWSNTLEGSRRKKAEEKKRQRDMEEYERQKIDAEESQIQLDQRKATIDRANKLLYEESDRMKSFHSKLMYSDVLAEREAQIALKDELQKLEQVREDRFLEMERQNYRKMLERELKEKETKEELSRVAARAQKEQLAEYKEKKFQEVEDQMLEGELLRRKAIEDLEAERKAERGRRAMAVQALAETQKANEYLKQIKAEDALRQEREVAKIQEYADRKDRMIALRKRKEEEVFAAKQAARNHIIEVESERLASFKCDEQARIDRQVQQKEASDDKKHWEKLDRQRRWEEDIQRSRAAQLERKRQERERARQEDEETAKFLGEWCKVLDKQERDELENRSRAARKLADEHKKMGEIARRRGDGEKETERIIAEQAKRSMEADTVEFHQYAEGVIREYADEGKNVIPLIQELRQFRIRSQQ